MATEKKLQYIFDKMFVLCSELALPFHNQIGTLAVCEIPAFFCEWNTKNKTNVFIREKVWIWLLFFVLELKRQQKQQTT